MVSRRPAWAFAHQASVAALSKHFGTANLEGMGFGEGGDDVQAIRAAGAILDYLAETQKSSLEHVDRLIPYRTSGTLEIDEASRRSLEISRTIRDGRREGSLLAVLDRTVTAMGSRLLAEWIANPLTDIAAISARHEAVGELVAEPALCGDLQETLPRVYDVERLLARVTTGRASPRDLNFLGRTLRTLPALKAKITARKSGLLGELEAGIDLCPELSGTLAAALLDDCPLSPRDGGFIRDGYSEELDGLRELARGGKQWIARYQAAGDRAVGHSELEGGLQQGVRVLHRDHQCPPRADSRRLHPQTDDQERRALRHAGVEGVRRKGAHGRREGEGVGVRFVREAPRSRGVRAAADSIDRADARAARRARRAGRTRPAAQLLPAGDGRSAVAKDHRRPPPRARHRRAGRNLRAERRVHRKILV